MNTSGDTSSGSAAPPAVPAVQEESAAPYAIAQDKPASSKPGGTLPPIATARPLGSIAQIQSHLAGGSNIPLNRNGESAAPYVTVTTMAPSALGADDRDVDDQRFQFLQRTRWMAAILLAYYLATFFFVQPFVVGASGILTGLIGYLSSRPPVGVERLKWVRWYIWLNYAMLGLNLWLLVLTFIAIGMSNTSQFDGTSDSDGSSSSSGSWLEGERLDDFSSFYTTNLGIYVGVLVGVNMVLHLRALRTAKLLQAELVACRFDPPLPYTVAVPISVPAPAATTSASAV